jgi:ribosomal protein S6
MQYELFYLVAGSKENDLPKIKESVKKIVAEEGGVFELKETVEKRRLAYKIKRESHGLYVASRFTLEDTEKVRSLTRKLNLYPEVLRFLVSRADELLPLLSREERIEASTRAEQQKARSLSAEKDFSRRGFESKKEPEKAKAAEKKPFKDEDIDKKLEEILNI